MRAFQTDKIDRGGTHFQGTFQARATDFFSGVLVLVWHLVGAEWERETRGPSLFVAENVYPLNVGLAGRIQFTFTVDPTLLESHDVLKCAGVSTTQHPPDAPSLWSDCRGMQDD